jgi:hypothetical protein
VTGTASADLSRHRPIKLIEGNVQERHKRVSGARDGAKTIDSRRQSRADRGVRDHAASARRNSSITTAVRAIGARNLFPDLANGKARQQLRRLLLKPPETSRKRSIGARFSLARYPLNRAGEEPGRNDARNRGVPMLAAPRTAAP